MAKLTKRGMDDFDADGGGSGAMGRLWVASQGWCLISAARAGERRLDGRLLGRSIVGAGDRFSGSGKRTR